MDDLSDTFILLFLQGSVFVLYGSNLNYAQRKMRPI